MNKLQKAWIEALRSEKYQKGFRYLQPTDNTYCALGVAVLVAEKSGVRVHRQPTSCWGRTATYLGLIGQSLSSQPEVLLALRLSNQGEDNVLTMNDGLDEKHYKCLTFKEIADIIEEQPEDYFDDSLEVTFADPLPMEVPDV